MIREAVDADTEQVGRVAVLSGLFEPSEQATVDGLMTDYFTTSRKDGHVCLVDCQTAPDDTDRSHASSESIVGVAYYQPAPATDRTWYLTLIAVVRDRQGQGRGAALLAAVEKRLTDDSQRLLLVETSGVPDFALTRAFYAKCGYDAEARVRDYFETGDDMVLFRKSLTDTP